MNREQQAGSECGVSHPDGYPRCDMKRGHEGTHMGSDRGCIYEWDATPPATPETPADYRRGYVDGWHAAAALRLDVPTRELVRGIREVLRAGDHSTPGGTK